MILYYRKSGKGHWHMKAKVVDLSTNDYAVHDEIREPEFHQGAVRDMEESIEPNAPPALLRKALHGPFKSIDLSKDVGRRELIMGLTLQIPLNENDLPLYFYRPDLLDHGRIAKVLRKYTAGEDVAPEMIEITGMLEASAIQLDFEQGYPLLPNGKAFWERFDFETEDAYSMFISYLELDGLRRIADLKQYPMMMMQDFYHQHYWVARAKAFDVYRFASSQRQRINRMLTSEDKHFRIAEKGIAKLETYFEQLNLLDEEGVAANLTPDKAAAMLEKLVGIARISIGLPKNGESKENVGVRQVLSPQQLIAQSSGAATSTHDAVDEEFEDLLDDPEAIALAQDLILRRQANGNMD